MKFKMSLFARLKSILPKKIVAVEFCEKCGKTQEIPWHCDSDELWREVTGEDNCVLCPLCFWELAWEMNIFIEFHATDDFRRNKKGDEWQSVYHSR